MCVCMCVCVCVCSLDREVYFLTDPRIVNTFILVISGFDTP